MGGSILPYPWCCLLFTQQLANRYLSQLKDAHSSHLFVQDYLKKAGVVSYDALCYTWLPNRKRCLIKWQRSTHQATDTYSRRSTWIEFSFILKIYYYCKETNHHIHTIIHKQVKSCELTTINCLLEYLHKNLLSNCLGIG